MSGMLANAAGPSFDQWALLACIPLAATFGAWMVKQIMDHAKVMAAITVQLTNTNTLASTTAAALAAMTTATAAELARKVEEQAATIEAQRRLDAAELARKVEQTAAALAAHP